MLMPLGVIGTEEEGDSSDIGEEILADELLEDLSEHVAVVAGKTAVDHIGHHHVVVGQTGHPRSFWVHEYEVAGFEFWCYLHGRSQVG